MLIDSEKLKQAVLTIMPERSEVLLIVDNQPEAVVPCKNCKHRPTKNLELEQILDFPDCVCPCQNMDDDYYSWYPEDDFFCAKGESNNVKD